MDFTALAQLPPGYAAQPAGAREYQLALIQMPNNVDYTAGADAAFEEILFSAPYLLINSEYRIGGVEYVQAVIESTDGSGQTDVAKTLIAEGHALVEQRPEPRFAQVVRCLIG